MIKIEYVVTPSWNEWLRVISGARNPMNSWGKMDTDEYGIGAHDYKLMMSLAKAGKDHRKFMRMLPVYMDITAPLYWWKEFDTYKVGTVANSCSTMHKIASKEFAIDDFSVEHLTGAFYDNLYNPNVIMHDIIGCLNGARKQYLETKDRAYWWDMIQLLPSSYNQKRTVYLNYEVLSNIYFARKNHKLSEWREFCETIKDLPMSELITLEDDE